MDDVRLALAPPRFVDGPPLRLAGLTGRYTPETAVGIPAQWQRFAPWLGRVPGQVGRDTFGVCTDMQGEGFGYVSAVEVASLDGLRPELTAVEIPARRYAVFAHRGPVSTLCQTLDAILRDGPAAAGCAFAAAGSGACFFERYGDAFDPKTASGLVEIWVPLDAADRRSATDEAAIHALVETVDQAHRRKDAAAIAACYTPDAVIYNLAPPLARHGIDLGELNAWLDGWDGPVAREPHDFRVTVSGDLAVAHGLYRLAATTKAGGHAVSLWMRATVGLRRAGGDWRIVHEHTSVPFHMDGSFRAAVDLAPAAA